MGKNPEVPRRRTLPGWVLEGLFIIVSVLLGFGVAQFGEYRGNRELAARALAGGPAALNEGSRLWFDGEM